MATYKAEFRAHYYEGRWRPRAAYSMGLIDRWARLASLAPGLVNWATRMPVLSDAIKWTGGIAPGRTVPAFARQTYYAWRRSRRDTMRPGRRVVLFADTFNNYLRPDVAIAATRVLEAAGCEVAMLPRPLCCGRPLYDWGMLDTAKRYLKRILQALANDIGAGTPVIGLEPACVTTFRDELVNLFPNDDLARRLSRQSYVLSEFLESQCRDFELPHIGGKALVQIHCHHHAVITDAAERAVLDRLGLDYEVLASGCCGMAGSFGFEADKYEISQAAGERVLLPRVRQAGADTLILADGFSCREQIEQGTGRRTRHLAEVIAGALPTRDQTPHGGDHALDR